MAQTKGPEFPGGDEMLKQFLKENTRYPYKAKTRKTYNVKTEVLVGKDGIVKFFNILSPENPKREIVKEVKRVIKNMPKWNPGGSYAADGTFVPEQWKTVVNFNFDPMNVGDSRTTCINVRKAGTLSSLLTQEQKDTCTRLLIMGKINSADIVTIREMAGENGCLEGIDLSGVRIVSSKKPYLRIEDAAKKISLRSRQIRDSYSYNPSWVRIPYSESPRIRDVRFGTPDINSFRNLNRGEGTRYLPPYRERTFMSSAWESFKRWWGFEPASYKVKTIQLFEGDSKWVSKSDLKELKPVHFKGHKLERDGGRFVLTAHTTKDVFATTCSINVRS